MVVTDNIGKNLTNVVASNGGIYDTITGFVTFPTISYFANSASQSYTVSFTAPPFGSVTNIVSNTSDTSDPTIANNNGTATNAKVVTVIPTKIVLVKRVTAINGNRAKNPNDGKVLGGFVDDNSSTDDNALGWPSNYLLGELNGGKVNPSDEIEYTVYFLNVGGASITSFRVCDLITGQQNFRADAYGVNQDIEMKIGKLANSSTFFTRFSGDDRAQVIGATGTVPAGCNLQGINTNATVVVDVTGSSVPVLPILAPSNGSGSPDNSFGFFRFVTKVKP